MPRKSFAESLSQVQGDILTLGDMVEKALVVSVECLSRRDFDGSRELIERDRLIDEKRYAIEAESLLLIATQQPAAGDLRGLAAALFIANELERIADYAKGIARINLRIGDESLLQPLVNIPSMAEAARRMVNGSLDAYIRRDAGLASAIIPSDDEVDALYEQVYADLMVLVVEDMARMRQANLLLMVAHNLERAADRATNICERVIYYVTGEFVESGWHFPFSEP